MYPLNSLRRHTIRSFTSIINPNRGSPIERPSVKLRLQNMMPCGYPTHEFQFNPSNLLHRLRIITLLESHHSPGHFPGHCCGTLMKIMMTEMGLLRFRAFPEAAKIISLAQCWSPLVAKELANRIDKTR